MKPDLFSPGFCDVDIFLPPPPPGPAGYNPTIQGCPECEFYVEPLLTEYDIRHHRGCRTYPTKNVISNPVNCNCNRYKKAAIKPYNLKPLPMNEGVINEKETLST